ncbi:MAG: T9SS type A sorting domain-containing protein [Saprospiraceae bacterium]
MRKLFTVLVLSFLSLVVFGQDGMRGDGFIPDGWNNPVGFSAGFGSSRILTRNPEGTGNRYFRLQNNGGSSDYGPHNCADEDITADVNQKYLTAWVCNNGAFYINCPNTTDNYVFKTPSANDDDFIYFRVQGDVRTVDMVTASPSVPIENSPTTITATLNGDINTGQGVYLRYSTDNFSSSTVVEMTASTASSFIADIPGQSNGTTLYFYVFTSGSGLTISPTDADWYTINGNNNGGSNYVLSVVPVELSSFTATKETNTVALNWTTLSEKNNAGFDIEKSVNGKDFEVIGTVEGTGNSIEKIDYNFIDENPTNGTNYYRLKQMDFDGVYEYSKILSVEINTKIQAIIYPNPTADNLTIRADIQDKVNIRVFNPFGELVYQNTQRIDNQTNIDFSSLPAGNYFLHITNDATQTIVFSNHFTKQ